MPKRTYYQVLGVAEDADAEEIRHSARAMAERFHPDRVSHRDKVLAAEYEITIKQINEAKQCLLDPVSRQRYNNLLKHQRARAGVLNIQVVSPAQAQGQYPPGQGQHAQAQTRYPMYQGPYLHTQGPPRQAGQPAQAARPAQQPPQVQLPQGPPARVVEMELEEDEDADIYVPRGKVAIECPGCTERFIVSGTTIGADVTCPNCGLKGGCGEGGENANGTSSVHPAGEQPNGPRLNCPACGKDFKLPSGCEKGDVLECPYCGVHGSLD